MPLIMEAQSIRTEYGKNRVQYHDDFDKWWMYETENFIVYWYGKGRNIAQSAIQMAEFVHPSIQNFVEHRINDKIEIIVYTDLSDLMQSNIGNEETFETTHQVTKVIGSRIFAYFDGNHRNMEWQLKEGIARVYLNAMYSKGSLQEIVDSEPDLEIPEWYQEGFVSFTGSAWNSQIEDELRDLWYRKKGKYRKFDRLANENPRVAGHSMWNYLAEEYGRTSVTTLLYLMRLRNNFDDNIEFVFGFDCRKLKRDWASFYVELFGAEKDGFDEWNEEEILELGYKKWFPKSTYEISPDGEEVIFAVNEHGKYQVIRRNLYTGDQNVIFKFGSKNRVQQADYNYPIIAWHPFRDEVTICYEKQDQIMLRKVDLNSKEYAEQSIPENFQRIYHLDYITDDEYFFNAISDGYSDFYVYRSRSRQHDQLTEDFYDDIDASYVQLGEQWGILFSSNRPSGNVIPQRLDTILPTTNFDVFFLPLESDFALQLTNTPDESEYQPRLSNGHYLTFLKDVNGVNNRWVLDLNSRRSPYPNSNLPRNIINHDAVKNSDVHIFQTYEDGAYKTYLQEPNWNTRSELFRTSAAVDFKVEDDEPEPVVIEEPQEVPSTFFDSEFGDPDYIEPLETNAKYQIIKRNYIESYGLDENPEVIKFIPARAVASRRQFKLEDVKATIDNEVLFEGLESYADEQAQTEVQQPGLLIKGIAKDIFEDFKVEMGVRIPTNLRGSEFFVVYDDRRKRIDKRIALYRRQRTENQIFNQRQKDVVWIGLHRWSYPFDTYRSVRATAQLRVDQRFLLHTDDLGRNAPSFNEKRASLKLEYVFDNALNIDLNLNHGTKYKAYVELINRFDLELGNDFSFDASRGFTAVFGFDARHYIPLLRNSILALRSAGATSFGSDRILYFVGGTDGWVTPKFNEETQVPQDRNFAFRTIAPNLRGFDHNVRNGNSFLLGSAELRIPFLKYLSARELKSTFLRNIQLVGFVDVGSAWHGFLPTNENNLINQTVIAGPRVLVNLELDKRLFAYSYGVGARINLLGYFIRADYAWGFESSIAQEPKLHISLGTDF